MDACAVLPTASSPRKRGSPFFGANAGPGRANAAYIAGVLASARERALPPDGVAALERLAREAGVTVESAPAPAPKVRPRFATPFDR